MRFELGDDFLAGAEELSWICHLTRLIRHATTRRGLGVTDSWGTRIDVVLVDPKCWHRRAAPISRLGRSAACGVDVAEGAGQLVVAAGEG